MKKILFVQPDYHGAFFLRRELRQLGWKADIFAPSSYPEELLFDDDCIRNLKTKNIKNKILKKIINYFSSAIFVPWLVIQYQYLIICGTIDIAPMPWDMLLRKIFGVNQNSLLAVCRMLGSKIIFIPSGCIDTESKKKFKMLDGGNVCENCGWENNVCTDQKSALRFSIIKKYVNIVIADGSFESTQFRAKQMRYKSLDLTLWAPHIEIPNEFRLEKTQNLRIMHSFYNKDRECNKKNIKGSPYILAAIEKLQNEGYSVEYFYVNNVPSKYMRFYQVQADIIADELIYGWWGATGAECMALGKPHICYLRPEWVAFFKSVFPEYAELPTISATTNDFYDVLKRLVVNKEYREKKGFDSRAFAEKHFDVKKNVLDFEIVLNSL